MQCEIRPGRRCLFQFTTLVWSPERGSFVETGGEATEVRVMAVVDAYVLARRPGCMPFVRSVKEFAKWAVRDVTPSAPARSRKRR